jgi:hypothetical protein
MSPMNRMVAKQDIVTPTATCQAQLARAVNMGCCVCQGLLVSCVGNSGLSKSLDVPKHLG